MTSSRNDIREEELRLPRPPGVVRRFWARHPLFADILIALVCLLLSLSPATTVSTTTSTEGGFSVTTTVPVLTSAAISAVIVAACALLLRRRRWPVAVAVGGYAAAASYLFVSTPVAGPLLLVTSYGLAVYRSPRAAWSGLAVGTGGLGLLAFALERTGVVSLQIALNAVLGELVLALIGTLVGANVGGRKRYLEAVIDRSRQLLVERDQHAQLAAAAERARIAREMHDIVSHSLTVIVALSEGSAATSDPARAKDAATAAAATARGALTEMRSMLGVLRDGGAEAPLAPNEPVDPRASVEAAQRAGYPVALTLVGEAEAAPAVEYAIGRIVQEGVTNAMRHAPTATRIAVRIDRSGDPVAIGIDNDGVTTPAGSGGFGLRGIAERAAHVGGAVRSGPVGDGRWMLRAELPRGWAPAGPPAGTEEG